MHVGLVIYGSLDTISGGYIYDRKLVEFLRRQGDEVDIISLPWRGYSGNLIDNFRPSVVRQLQSFRGDILLQDELNHPSLFWLNRRLKPHLRTPLVSIVHHLRASEKHPSWLAPLYRGIERAYLTSLEGFVFNSQTTQRSVEKILGHEIARSVVAPPGGDRWGIELGEEEILARLYRPGPIQLLFVGNVIPRKGLHILFEALSALQELEWELNIVGNMRVATKYIKKLNKLVSHKGWTNRVYFHDAVDDKAVASWMENSHVLVVPSSYEGFGIVYLEGKGFGLPAIGTISGGAGEIISDGVDGFTINPGDARSLANCLKILMNNQDLLAMMSLNARRNFSRHPCWNESMASIRDYLARLIDKGGVLIRG